MTKKLVRLYPIRFRYLEGRQQFKKYQWIKVYLRQASTDPRPESHHIDSNSIEIGNVVPTGKAWEDRYTWLINQHTVLPSVKALRKAQIETGKSLGIVKPSKINGVVIQHRNQKDVQEAINKKESVVRQLDFFETKKDLYILPVKILLDFSCNAPDCPGHRMSILDWEFGQLYRKISKTEGWEEKIKTKIMNEICGPERETFLILGNMAAYPQTFCILGFFWPPKVHSRQIPLFS